MGMESPSSGKLHRAAAPRMARAALSYARAASSAVSNVPSHLRMVCRIKAGGRHHHQAQNVSPNKRACIPSQQTNARDCKATCKGK